MRAVEELDFGSVRNSKLLVKPPDFGVFVRAPFVYPDAVVMPAFHHKWPGRNQRGHFRVIESVAQIPFRHFVLAGEHVTARKIGGNILVSHLLKWGGENG